MNAHLIIARPKISMSMLIYSVLCCGLLSTSLWASDMPVSAEIVDVPAERMDWGEPIGNVRVKFADGHSEFWTRKGRCMHVRRSKSGLVGWSRFSTRNSHGEPVNDVLRVMVTTSTWKDIKVDLLIEEWDFSDSDTTVIIKMRGRHGPATVQKYSLETGKLIASAEASVPYADTPDWAKPFSDDPPPK